MDVDPKSTAVDVDLVFEGAIRAAPAAAWEESHSKRVPVDVHLEVFVPPPGGGGVILKI